MKSIIATVLLVAALASGAQAANVVRDLATTGSIVTTHGLFDGR